MSYTGWSWQHWSAPWFVVKLHKYLEWREVLERYLRNKRITPILWLSVYFKFMFYRILCPVFMKIIIPHVWCISMCSYFQHVECSATRISINPSIKRLLPDSTQDFGHVSGCPVFSGYKGRTQQLVQSYTVVVPKP